MRLLTTSQLVCALLMLFGVVACHSRDRKTCGESKTGRRLKHAGQEIYYEVHGEGPRTLVLIHGWTGSLEVWKYQLDAFPQYRVVAIDLPGNGRSGRAEGATYTMEAFAEAVRAVLGAEQIHRAFFFGHSMGFAVVEVIASKFPQLCAGLGAIDGAHFEVPRDADGQAKWQQETEAFAAGMTTESAREEFLNMLFLPDTPALLKEEVLRTSRTVPLSLGRSMIAGVIADLKYWLPKRVEIPCLAVYSPAYQLPPTFREDFLRMYPKTEYVDVQNVSHFFMLEVPYRLNQIIVDFVERH